MIKWEYLYDLIEGSLPETNVSEYEPVKDVRLQHYLQSIGEIGWEVITAELFLRNRKSYLRIFAKRKMN